MKAIYAYYLLLLLGLLVSVSCTPNSTPSNSRITLQEGDLVFTHVNVIPMQSEQAEVRENQHVYVRQGQIYQMGPAAEISLPAGVQQIDGKGKYLLPGLAEMHAHIPVPRGEKDSLVYETMWLYLANGVTTIRGMLGDPFHLDFREDANSGKILAPRVYTSGPSCNGNTVPTPEAARERVEAQKAAGYDFLKLHPGIPLEAFDTLVATANRVGIPYAGHVSIHVGIRHALNSQYASVDHLDGYIEGMVSKDAEVDPSANGFFGYNFTDLLDPSQIDELVSLTKENEVAVVLTQTLFERWLGAADPNAVGAEPEMAYMHPRTVKNWVGGANALHNGELYDPQRVQKYNDIRRQLIKKLYDGGVLMLLGSDSPQVFNVPGFSIHREMQTMIDAGLTPYQVLLTGTINPAKYFGREGDFGTIQPGASADLMLVNANPLDDLGNLRKPAGVMMRGNWLPKDMLDKELEAIKTRYASLGEE